jgi:hypothetical protein
MFLQKEESACSLEHVAGIAAHLPSWLQLILLLLCSVLGEHERLRQHLVDLESRRERRKRDAAARERLFGRQEEKAGLEGPGELREGGPRQVPCACRLPADQVALQAVLAVALLLPLHIRI